MKIHGSPGAPAQGVDLALRAKRGAEARAQGGSTDPALIRSARPGAEGVSVSLSAAAQQKVDAAAAKPMFDVDKVDRLRAVLETGPLAIDAVAIAQRLLPDDEGDAT